MDELMKGVKIGKILSGEDKNRKFKGLAIALSVVTIILSVLSIAYVVYTLINRNNYDDFEDDFDDLFDEEYDDEFEDEFED